MNYKTLLIAFFFVNVIYISKASEILIKNVPHIRQKPDFCGEACTAMYLQKLGYKEITQDDVFNLTEVDPHQARGAYTRDMKVALSSLGFKPGKIWHSVKAEDSEAIKDEWDKIVANLADNIPTIVCMNTDGGTEHMRLILGYDESRKEISYHEPGDKNGAYKTMKLDKFLKLWPLKYNSRKWQLISMPLKFDKINPPHKNKGFTKADFAQHIMRLKKKIPKKGNFNYIIQSPFVVIGDEKESLVKMRAEKTVKWATDKLKKDFFKKDPEYIIDIWLFKDKKSYKSNTWKIFKDTPSTPFGYSSHSERALVMNIATGGGTLVHEIVHPFMRSNFPKCPSWFNEGLASLYEQCGERNGKITGFTNWRLAGLQSAIRNKKVPAFKTLTNTTEHEFYSEDPGTNYSQARYLCYYLQEKKLLRKFYHEFVKNHEQDPSGYKTLQKILGEKDMISFKEKWEKYVLGLRFR